MKKKGFVAGIISMALVMGFCLTGCTSLTNSYMDKDITVREHALLLVNPNIAVTNIDGEFQMKDRTHPLISKAILLTPGKHEISVQWYTVTQFQTATTVTTTTTKSSFVGFSNDFLAGRIYRITAEKSGRNISFFLNEENDMSIWNSKKVAKAKPPKQTITTAFTLIQRAAAAPPTELEGEWNLRLTPEMREKQPLFIGASLSITGLTYTQLSTRMLTDVQVAEFRKLGVAADNIQTMGSRYVFTIDGNSITLLASTGQTSNDSVIWTTTASMGSSKSKSLAKIIAKIPDLVYEYSFSPEGNLLLKMKVPEGTDPALKKAIEDAPPVVYVRSTKEKTTEE